MSEPVLPGDCIYCGHSESKPGYSNPPTAQCLNCGKFWAYGPGAPPVEEQKKREPRP